MRRPSLLFVNRSYWPDAEATGQLLTELSEDLVAGRRFEVTVCCGRPNVSAGEASGVSERNGVGIARVPHTRFSKRTLAGRLTNFVTFAAGAAWRLLTGPRPDLYVVETDPFLLPPLVAVVAWLRRRPFVCYLQDLQPGVAVAIGMTRAESVSARAMTAIADFAYRRAAKVIVLSDDMAETVASRGVPRGRIAVVPNWADTERLRPPTAETVRTARTRLGLRGPVVMHSGNMGLTQRLGDLLEAAAVLQASDDPLARSVTIALVGGGAKEAELKRRAAELGLANVLFRPYQEKTDLAASLGAAELHLISTEPAAVGHLMPSKLYGVLAVGRPVLAVAPAGCELSRVVVGEGVGTVTAPGDSGRLAEAIVTALSDRTTLAERGRRARRVAERDYARAVVTGRLAGVFGEAVGVPTVEVEKKAA